MDIKQLMFMKATNKGTIETGYTHENVKKLTFIGNPYAWENAQAVDKPNLLVIPPSTRSKYGIECVSHDNILTINGTGTGTEDDVIATISTNIPAGSYKAVVDAYMGNSEVVDGKNMYIDFFYEGASSYSVRAKLEGVKNSKVSVNVTLAEPAVQVKVWYGVRAVKYDDYRLFYALFDSTYQTIKDAGAPVANGQTLDVTLDSTASFVYTMQHQSSVKK